MNFLTTAVYTVPGTSDPVTTIENECLRNVNCGVGAYQALGNDVEVLKDEIQGDTLDREVAIHPHGSTVPGILKVLLGDDALDYVQKTTYNFSTHTGTLQTEMQNSTMRKTIESKGSFSLRSNAPSAPRDVTYNLDSELNAHIWLIGTKVEKSIIKELHERAPRLEAFNQAWINDAVAPAESAALEAPVGTITEAA